MPTTRGEIAIARDPRARLPRDRIRRRAPLFSGDRRIVPAPSLAPLPFDPPIAQDDPWNDRPQGDADNGTAGMDVDGDDAEENFENAVVLAEDKKYYPTLGGVRPRD